MQNKKMVDLHKKKISNGCVKYCVLRHQRSNTLDHVFITMKTEFTLQDILKKI